MWKDKIWPAVQPAVVEALRVFVLRIAPLLLAALTGAALEAQHGVAVGQAVRLALFG